MALTFGCLSGGSLVSVRGKIWEANKIQTGVIKRPQLKYAVLIYQSCNKTKKGDSGVWRDFSELKREIVVGKFIMSYSSYAYMFRLKPGSQNMWADGTGKNIQDLLYRHEEFQPFLSFWT